MKSEKTENWSIEKKEPNLRSCKKMSEGGSYRTDLGKSQSRKEEEDREKQLWILTQCGMLITLN
jgi:hypothetical protein